MDDGELEWPKRFDTYKDWRLKKHQNQAKNDYFSQEEKPRILQYQHQSRIQPLGTLPLLLQEKSQ